MSFKLNKPYTDVERADFVCEHQGLNPVETDLAFFFLETNEIFQDGEVIINPNYEAEQLATENATKKLELQAQIDELDKKRIRAIAEPELKDGEQTWLEFYTLQIQELREQIGGLDASL